MQQGSEATRLYAKTDPGALSAAAMASDEVGIDPMTLARLDVGLFICLQNLGTSRQRICSALCLSYAEHDCIEKLLQAP